MLWTSELDESSAGPVTGTRERLGGRAAWTVGLIGDDPIALSDLGLKRMGLDGELKVELKVEVKAEVDVEGRRRSGVSARAAKYPSVLQGSTIGIVLLLDLALLFWREVEGVVERPSRDLE